MFLPNTNIKYTYKNGKVLHEGDLVYDKLNADIARYTKTHKLHYLETAKVSGGMFHCPFLYSKVSNKKYINILFFLNKINSKFLKGVKLNGN